MYYTHSLTIMAKKKRIFLSNNGQGFTLEEAQYVSSNLRQGNAVTITNVVIKPI